MSGCTFSRPVLRSMSALAANPTVFLALMFSVVAQLALAVSPTLSLAADVRRLAAGIDSLFATWNHPDTPGAAVVLTDGSRIVLERCYGLADLEDQVPITPVTRFELASVSKNLTAFGVLLLAREGRLGLDDKITLYLPELPDHGITIRNLLNQTSGVSEYFRILPYMGNPDIDRIRTRDFMVMLQHQAAPDFSPGSRWAYSNTNYLLLAEIVSRVTSRPFGEWMSERVFEPLEMFDTSFSDDGTEILPYRANGYSRRNGRLIRRISERPDRPGPDHAFSTIGDMAKWMDNFRTGRLGGMDLIGEMQRKCVLSNEEEFLYGFGLGIGNYRGVRTVGHSGGTGAFRSEMVYCPELEVGVVVLANDSSVKAGTLARAVLDLYLGDRLAPPPTSPEGTSQQEPRPFLRLDPEKLDQFVGSYRLESDPTALIVVAREEDRLAGILVGMGMAMFQPVGEEEFEDQARNTQITFIDGPEGFPTRMRLVHRGDEMWADRVPQSKDPARSAEYAGIYYSDEWGTLYEILPEGEGFLIRHRRMGDRPLQEVESDRLAGGLGLLTFFRDARGHIAGFMFEEPEDLPGRRVEFRKCEFAQTAAGPGSGGSAREGEVTGTPQVLGPGRNMRRSQELSLPGLSVNRNAS